MNKPINCRSAAEFHTFTQKLNEGIKPNNVLRTDLTFKQKDGRFYRFIKILLSIFPGDRFANTRIYNVAAAIEKLYNTHASWVGVEDKECFNNVLKFLDQAANRSKDLKQKARYTSALKKARETLGLTAENGSNKEPSFPLGELGKALQEINYPLQSSDKTSEEVAKQNREKAKSLCLPSLLNLNQEEKLSAQNRQVLFSLLCDSEGEWLKNNFSKLTPSAITLITQSCRLSPSSAYNFWFKIFIPTLKEGSDAQQTAFVAAFQQSHQDQQEAKSLAAHALQVIGQWQDHQELFSKLSLEEQKSLIKGLVAYAAHTEKGLDSTLEFIEGLSSPNKLAAIEELNKNAAPNVLFGIINKGWGNDQTLDSLAKAKLQPSWIKSFINSIHPNQTSGCLKVYRLLISSQNDRSAELKYFFSNLPLSGKEILQCIGQEANPDHLKKISQGIFSSHNPTTLLQIVDGLKQMPKSDQRDESLKMIATMLLPAMGSIEFPAAFHNHKDACEALFETDVEAFQFTLIKNLSHEKFLPFIKKLSPEKLKTFGESLTDFDLKFQRYHSKLAQELEPDQVAALLNGIQNTTNTDSLKTTTLTAYLKTLAVSGSKNKIPKLVDLLEFPTLVNINLSNLFDDLRPLLIDMSSPNQKLLIQKGVVDLLNSSSNESQTPREAFSSVCERLSNLRKAQLEVLQVETLPTPLAFIALSLSSLDVEKCTKSLDYFDDLGICQENLDDFSQLLKINDEISTTFFEALINLHTSQKKIALQLLPKIIEHWSLKYSTGQELPQKILDLINLMPSKLFQDLMVNFSSEEIKWSLLENFNFKAELKDAALNLWIDNLPLTSESAPRFAYFLEYLEETKMLDTLKILLSKKHLSQTNSNVEEVFKITLLHLENDISPLNKLKAEDIDWNFLKEAYEKYADFENDFICPNCFEVIKNKLKS